MLQVNGSISILPEAVRTEPTEIRIGGEETPSDSAVLMSLKTASGIVQVIFPLDDIGEIIKGLTQSKEAAEVAPKSDLVIANNMDSVKGFAEDLAKMNEENANRS